VEKKIRKMRRRKMQQIMVGKIVGTAHDLSFDHGISVGSRLKLE
jgi:hypothetical protein